MTQPKAKQRLFRTEDDEVVAENDPRARFLLAGIGDEIPKGFKVPNHLSGDPDEATPEDEEPPDDAAAKGAAKPADKQASKAANK